MNNVEKISNAGESAQTSAEKHPLEDMPSFEEHMSQIKSSKAESAQSEQLNTLRESLKQAEADGDEVAIEGIKNVIKMIGDEKQIESTSDKSEQEKPSFEVVPFAEIAKELEDPRYEELGHGTISAENAQNILNEGLKVGGPGRDTDIQSNFMRLANTDADTLRNATEDWQHNNAKFIVIYRIPFEYKMPLANQHSSETYGMFYESDNDSDGESGKYSKDFAYAYLDVNTGLAYKNSAYKGDLDDPAQKMAMENKYHFLRNETANKISDPEAREIFLSMVESWHEMGESMMPKQPEQTETLPDVEKDEQVESTAEDISVIVERDSGRTKVASGEMSSIYRIEKSDGKISTQVESDYYDTAERFMNSHPNVKNNFELSTAISGLATDLALVDATRGHNLTNGSLEQKAGLMKDYGALMDILDNPETSDSDKRAINEYFDSLDGDALKMIRENYNERPTGSSAEELNARQNLGEEQNGKTEQQIEEAKVNLESLKTILSNDSTALDKALFEINELTQSGNRTIDIDLLESKLNALTRANEDLRSSSMNFLQANTDYESNVINSANVLSGQKVSDERKYASENEEYLTDIARKTSDIGDRITKIRQYIDEVKRIA